MKIYVATSWRNQTQPIIVQYLRKAGHEVYDFRNPDYPDGPEGDHGFHWEQIDSHWEQWTPTQFRKSLSHPEAIKGFDTDFDAMKWCNAMLLVLPCGRSSHLEMGWAVGAGKKTAIMLADGEPELMYAMVDTLLTTLSEMDAWLES